MKSTYNNQDLLSEIFTNGNITKDLKNYSESLFYKSKSICYSLAVSR